MIKKFKLFEKVGIKTDIMIFSIELYNFILDNYNKNNDVMYFPIEKIPKDIINDKIVKQFKIILNKKIKNPRINIFLINQNSLNVVLELDRLTIPNITHEIFHLFQYIKKRFKLSKNAKLNDNILHYLSNTEIDMFNYLIYLTIKEEMDAFINGCITRLLLNDTTIDNFEEKLKQTVEYKLAKMLIKHNDTKVKYPQDFVNKWFFYYKNGKHFKKKSFFNKLLPIKLPLYMKKVSSIIPNKYFYYDEISYDDSIKFIKKWEKEFEKSGYELLKRLHKLYYFIDIYNKDKK